MNAPRRHEKTVRVDIPTSIAPLALTPAPGVGGGPPASFDLAGNDRNAVLFAPPTP